MTGLEGGFAEFEAHLGAMTDDEVISAYKFEGGEGARAELIAAEISRRGISV